MSRLAKSDKHFLADPALAARLLDVTEEELLTGRDRGISGQPLVGPLFEHLVAMGMQVYAAAAEARVGHLRTADGGREVDLIVERRGRVIAAEVKLAA